MIMNMLRDNFSRRFWKLLPSLFVILLYSRRLESKQCIQNDKCSCTFDDGSGVMDLSNLGISSGPPLINDEPADDGYVYSFNPCYPFGEGSCVNAAGCQVDVVYSLYYNIGDSEKVTFNFDGTNVIGTYIADDDVRSSEVTFICDPGVTNPTFVVNGEDPPGTPQYSFSITSSAVCPNAGQPTDGPSHTTGEASVSAGWILIIITTIYDTRAKTSQNQVKPEELVVVCLGFVYIVAGVLFNKLYRKETGKDVLPNTGFWGSLPGLVKDGVGFTYAKIRRREYQKI